MSNPAKLFIPATKRCYACEHNLTDKIKQCYACKNDMVGQFKNQYEDWECCCDVWKCECKESNLLQCPICNETFFESEHLADNIFKEKTRWIANMITHYRHNHIRSWNRLWEKNGYNYQRAAKFTDYGDEKRKVNERAKRQILKKCKHFLIENGFTQEDFLLLQGEAEKPTLELLNKTLPLSTKILHKHSL